MMWGRRQWGREERGRARVAGLATGAVGVVGWWILVAGLGVVGCSRSGSEGRGGAAGAPIEVRAVPAREGTVPRTIRVAGSLLAQDVAPLSIQVSGRLERISVDLGSRVKAGEVVAEVDRRDYELGVRRSKGALAQARARLGLPLEGEDDEVEIESTPLVRQARAVLLEKLRELERLRTLADQKVASQADLETAQAAHEVAVGGVEDALEEVRNRRAVLSQRRAEYDIAKKQLADTRLLAPFEGVVQERRANLGEFLAAGTPVVTLVRVDPLRLRLEVPEREAVRVQVGQVVRVMVEGVTNISEGQIRRLSPAITRESRVLVVEAEVPAGQGLRPGAFARAEIVAGSGLPSVIVPPSAVASFAGIEKVFVVDGGRAAERFLSTGERGPDYVEVASGVRAGELVILDPGGLRNGQPVTVRP